MTFWILSGVIPAWAGDDILLLGCEENGDGGATVILSQGTSRFRLRDGSVVQPDDLVGMRCVAALRLLLDNNLVKADDIGASSHLVISSTQGDGPGTDVPDCIIWNIDSANVTRQLTCDPLRGAVIVGEDSAFSGGSSTEPQDFIGRRCADALSDLGGLSNVIRSSIARPPAPGSDFTNDLAGTTLPAGSVLFYQMDLRVR
ncbi:MAG: hypothetical protein OEU74_06745 [Gammaproteobacteria bacterium]|nr:hypothetical protein [Gammaproteobacteria bacterium]